MTIVDYILYLGGALSLLSVITVAILNCTVFADRDVVEVKVKAVNKSHIVYITAAQ